jgi:hypothetical protein
VEFEQGPQGHGDGHPVGVADRVVEAQRHRRAKQAAQVRDALGDGDTHHADMAEIELGGQGEQTAKRAAEGRGIPAHPLELRQRAAAKVRGKRRLAVAHGGLRGEDSAQVRRRRPVAPRGEHPREQLLGGLARLEVEELRGILAGKQQPRLQLEQRGHEDDELRCRLEIELAAGVEMVEVGDHDLGQRELAKIDLLTQHQGQQQVEGTAEDVEVQLELREMHRRNASAASRRRVAS